MRIQATQTQLFPLRNPCRAPRIDSVQIERLDGKGGSGIQIEMRTPSWFIKAFRPWSESIIAAMPAMSDAAVRVYLLVLERIGSDPRIINTAHFIHLDPCADADLLDMHRSTFSSAKSWLIDQRLLELPADRHGQVVIPRERVHGDIRHPVHRSSWVRVPIRQLYTGSLVAYRHGITHPSTAAPTVIPYAPPTAGVMLDPATGQKRRVLINVPAPLMDRRPFAQVRRPFLRLLPSLRTSTPATRSAALYVLALAASGILGINGPGLLVLDPATASEECGCDPSTWRRGLAVLLDRGVLHQVTGCAYRLDSSMIRCGNIVDMGPRSNHLHAAARRQHSRVRRSAEIVTSAAAAESRKICAS